MASSFSDKTPPPFNRKIDNYAKWKKKFELWQSITEVTAVRQGGLLVLRMDDDTQDHIMETLTINEIKSE